MIDVKLLRENPDLVRASQRARGEDQGLVDALLDALGHVNGDVVIVSDEVGLGVHPSSDVGRAFRDALGSVNQLVAERADRVFLVVAGQLLQLKGAPS